MVLERQNWNWTDKIQAGEIIDAAIALEKAGAVGLFLTALSEQAAKYVSEHVNIPTIGIGYPFPVSTIPYTVNWLKQLRKCL